MTDGQARVAEFSNSDVEAALVRGAVTFMGLDLLVAPGALVPRPETEILGRAAVAKVEEAAKAGAPWVIDMCCGAGNLACAVATSVPEARVWCSDLTDACVAVARTNIARHGLGQQISVAQGDLFAPLASAGLERQVDVVVCNPPYISTSRLGKDRAELLAREPREAFDGGPYGLSIHQRVMRDALTFLKPGGWLLMEFGLGQDRQLTTLFARSGSYSSVGFALDEQGQSRVVMARREG
jgi:HemK-like putative methylase